MQEINLLIKITANNIPLILTCHLLVLLLILTQLGFMFMFEAILEEFRQTHHAWLTI